MLRDAGDLGDRDPRTGGAAGPLLFRFVTFWLPILPGWIALTTMQRRGEP